MDCAYTNNWGAALAYNPTNTYQYIAGRAATFFQLILYGIPMSLGTTQFTECENYRHGSSTGCNPADNNAGCSDDNTTCP